MSTKILRTKKVLDRIGMSRTSLWRKVRDGEFPPGIKLGPNSIGWKEEVVEEWLSNCETQDYGAASKETA